MHKMTTDAPLLKYIFNMFTASSDVSMQGRQLLYSPNPRCDWCEFFYVPQESDYCKCCETGIRFFVLIPRRLVCRCHALSSQLFEDSECWSGQGSSPRTPAQLTRALQTELTRRWLERKRILFTATTQPRKDAT